METAFFLLPLLALAACHETGDGNEIDPRSVEYNNRAVEMMQHFIHEAVPDTTQWAQAETFTDSVRVLFRDIVDSCQSLLDSAVKYSPRHYFYYAQKARFYLYRIDHENAYAWTLKALEKKELPELRIAAGMLLQKMGKEQEAETHYAQVIGRYEARNTLSRADLMNYTFALVLTRQQDKARQTIDSLARDTLLKRQLLSLIANPQEIIDAAIP